MADKKTDKKIIAYKGFDKDLKCRDFQYKIGGKYIHKGKVEPCESGFHACEYPLDVFLYYNPARSRFAEVEASGEIVPHENKICCEKIKIKTELTLGALIQAAVKFTFARVKWTKKNHVENKKEAASATGNCGAASATGNYGAASATGNCGAASATGNYGAASATGNWGAASATGNYGAASATGNYGAASATGNWGAASATGNCGAASATGNWGAASATGDCGAASATGNCGAASATGNCGAASATGNYGAASATGNCGAASATGNCGAASATGNYGAASATGNWGAASATGKESIACGLGFSCKAKGAKGCWLVIAERDNNGCILSVRTVRVDGKDIKEDTWYTLQDGQFVEAKV